MCMAMRDLMKEEIETEVQTKSQQAVDIALIAVIRSIMEKNKISASEAMALMSIPADDQIRYASII